MARFDTTGWSNPEIVLGSAGELAWDAFAPSLFGQDPTIVEDSTGRLHAVWMGMPYADNGARVLHHSEMAAGETSWSLPDVIADSALAFHLVRGSDLRLTLAYVRVGHGPEVSAGISVRQMDLARNLWDKPVSVNEVTGPEISISKQPHIRIAAAADGEIHVTWDYSGVGPAMYAGSTDGGLTWSSTEVLGDENGSAARPRVFALPGGSAIRLWQEASAAESCVLYQQQLSVSGSAERLWGAPQRVLERAEQCPESDRGWAYGAGLLWIWGEGSDSLTMTRWDGAVGRWSEPVRFAFRFQQEGTGQAAELMDLRAVLSEDTVTVVAIEQASADVWVVREQIDALPLASARPPWTYPVRLSGPGMVVGGPALAIGAEGSVHVVWSQVSIEPSHGEAIFCGTWAPSAERWSGANEVIAEPSEPGKAREPSLYADARGALHLVWSDQGQILYSKLEATGDDSLDQWSSPRPLPVPVPAASWPQVGADGGGRVFVAYAVQQNSQGGIFLTRSADGGETWSQPERVFGAADNDWDAVAHAALAVAYDGVVHVAAAPSASTTSAQGVYYARSRSPAQWTAPAQVMAAQCEWPEMGLVDGTLHLVCDGAESGVWYRASSRIEPGGRAEVSWQAEQRLPGWDGASVAITFVADDAGRLHLVGGSEEGGALLHAIWGGSAWSPPETVTLAPEIGAIRGVGAAALPRGAGITVAFYAERLSGEGGAESGVYLMTRALHDLPVQEPVADPTPSPIPSPSSTAVQTQEPTATVTASPQATAHRAPEPASASPVLPLLLVGGLAIGVALLGFASWRSWRNRA